jgi:hypothetical protein
MKPGHACLRFPLGVSSYSAKLPLTVSELARAPISTVPGFVPVATHFGLIESISANIKMPRLYIGICRGESPKTPSDSPISKLMTVAVTVAPEQLGSLPFGQIVFRLAIYPAHLLASEEKAKSEMILTAGASQIPHRHW